MNLQAKATSAKRKLISSKPIFKATIAIIILTILTVWLWGSLIHRTVFSNALISTNILSVACALVLSVGLFNGVKLKDTLGKITDQFKWSVLPKLPKLPKLSSKGGGDFGGGLDLDGDLLEGLFYIIFALLALLLSLFLFWIFGNLLWAGTLMLEATLYWIFFRVARRVLKHARKCRGKWIMSLTHGFIYTAGYSLLFYALILLPHLLHK